MNMEKIVCNCMNVTNGAIKEAVDVGAISLFFCFPTIG